MFFYISLKVCLTFSLILSTPVICLHVQLTQQWVLNGYESYVLELAGLEIIAHPGSVMALCNGGVIFCSAWTQIKMWLSYLRKRNIILPIAKEQRQQLAEGTQMGSYGLDQRNISRDNGHMSFLDYHFAWLCRDKKYLVVQGKYSCNQRCLRKTAMEAKWNNTSTAFCRCSQLQFSKINWKKQDLKIKPL